MRRARFVCVIATLVGGPAAVVADPPPNDPWYYSVWLDHATPGPHGGAGDLRHEVVAAGPDWYKPGTHPRPDFVSVWLRPITPAHPHWEPGTSVLVADDTRFAVNVMFTDTATGASDTITVTGTARSEWMKRWDGRVDPEQARVTFDPGTWTATVGGTTFAITTRDEHTPRYDPGQGNGRITGGLQLTATPVTAQTPEPGTLALAAVGLLPVVGLYRRRKS